MSERRHRASRPRAALRSGSRARRHPVGRSAHRSASARSAPGIGPEPGARIGGGRGRGERAPPIVTRDEALAAGGRRAAGPRRGPSCGRASMSPTGRVASTGAASRMAGSISRSPRRPRAPGWWTSGTGGTGRVPGGRACAFTAYHYANPGPGRDDATREADFFLRHARLHGTATWCPPWTSRRPAAWAPAELQRWTLQWLRRVEHKLGRRSRCCTPAPGFWTGEADNSRSIARAGFRTLWISHWETRRPRRARVPLGRRGLDLLAVDRDGQRAGRHRVGWTATSTAARGLAS